ncbi:MAG: hypothetical protein AAGH74_07475 [Pseudomonadota bacterium]
MRAFPLLIALISAPAIAGDVEITDAKARKSGEAWRFEVTLLHADTGWDHYADAWRVVGPDGTIYGTRILAHPHVNEQPFTRSLSGVQIPRGVTSVTIEAKDSVHGWAEATYSLDLE